MSRWLLVASLLAACGDDSGGGDGGVTGGSGALETHASMFPSGPTNFTLNTPQYNDRLLTADGTRAHSIGEVNPLQAFLLARYDNAQLVGATQFTGLRQVTSMLEDGAGGVFLLGTVIDANERFHPAVAHFAADGTLAWAKSYTAMLPAIWGIAGVPGNFAAEPVFSQIVDGKIALVAGAGVMVIDTSGAVQWASALPQVFQLSQIVADAGGLVAFGMHYADLIEIRYDWSGALVGKSNAVNAVTNPAYGMQFGTPLRADAGTISLPFAWRLPSSRSPDGLGASGVLVIGSDGAIADDYGYEIDGEFAPTQIRAKVGPIGELHLLSPSVVQADFYYKDTFMVPPVLTRSYFVMSADAKKYSQVQNESVMMPSGSVMELNGSAISTDTIGDACSYAAFEVRSMARVAGPPIPAFTPIAGSLGEEAVVPVVADVALGPLDEGAPTLIGGSNSCHHADTGF